MESSERTERRVFAGLTAFAACVMGALPVIPGHDIPQHLAYLRLMVAWRRNPATYPAGYAPPDLSNGYATTYKWLTPLADWTSPEIAARIVLATYVVLLAIAVRALIRATWSDRGRAGSFATSTLGPLAAFNPVLCMGFLPYVLSLPPLVGSIAASVSYLRKGQTRFLVLAAFLAAATGAFHLIAVAALLFFVAAMWVARRDRSATFVLLSTLVGALLGSRIAGGGPQLSDALKAHLREQIANRGLIHGSMAALGISQTQWSEKLSQVVAAVIGPFNSSGKAIALAILVATLVVDAWLRRRARPTNKQMDAVVGVRPACLALLFAAILAPGAIQVPDDICLLDFRLITTALIVGIAAIRPGALSSQRVFPLGAGVSLALVLWFRQLAGSAEEVMQMARLVTKLQPSDRLLALSMHDASAYLDDSNGILHYAAVYHTVQTGGVTSLFWGKWTPRLPVGFLPGAEPKAPPDWSPWMLTDEQMSDFSHVIVRWPGADDDDELRDLSERVRHMVSVGRLVPVAVDGQCALFRVKTESEDQRQSSIFSE